MKVMSDGLPVCGNVNNLNTVATDMWDVSQNMPSSQSGLSQTFFQHKGLGSNIESLFMQAYDPYNFPAANLYEWDNCEGESASFGVRNFTIKADGEVYEQPYSLFNVSSPASNANSFRVPFNTQLELFEDEQLQATLKCENVTGCGCMTAT